MDGSSCDFQSEDFIIYGINGEVLTADSSPFSYDGETIFFQSSNEDD